MPEFLQTNTAHLARLMVLLLCLPAGLLQAQVQSRLSHQVTGLDQPVQLSIEIDGGEDLSPDLTPLEQDFEILSRSTQQSISVINGEMTSKRSLNLMLLPLRSGSLTIPAIQVGDQTTQPLPLQVEQQPQQEAQTTKQALIELSLNKDSAYLEEQILLTLKLYQAKGVRGESLDSPVASLDDTQLSLIHEDRYSSRKDGVDYRVVERVYALFARQTGRLTLDGVKFRGRSGGNRDPFSSFFSNGFPSHQQPGRIIRADSKPVSLEILPIPQDFTGERWLPAKNLQIVENGIESDMPLAGSPITRRVMIIADGVMSNHLPSIEQSMPSGLKLYPESPHLNDKPNRSGISSSLQQNLTLIATDPGTYILPPIEIPWWNTETRRQEIARLPAKQISFMPNPSGIANQAQPSAAAQSSDQKLSAEKPISASPEPAADFPWMATLFGLAWLITVTAWWFSSRQKQPAKPVTVEQPSQKRSSPTELESVLQKLADAYHSRDEQTARDAWLHWALLNWPNNPPNNLSRLARRCDADLATAVNALERAIYSPNSEISWSDYEILKLIEAKGSGQSQDKTDQNLLIPLNP